MRGDGLENLEAVVHLNKSWIGRMVAEHGERLRSFLRHRVGRADEVADLAQEVYLRLLRLPESATVTNPEGYVFAVANNLVKERALLTRRFAQSVAHDAREIEIELALNPPFGAEVDADRSVRLLHEALAELSPKCRAVVVLHYRDEMSYAEIALRLGISAAMAKKYRHKALLHCRRCMGHLR
jgi:RNA polymerase sigma factor (sigma-70 family)